MDGGGELWRGGELAEVNQKQTGRLGQCWVCSKAPDCLVLVAVRGGPESRTNRREVDWSLPQHQPRLVDVEAWFRWRWYSWVCGVVIMGRDSLLLCLNSACEGRLSYSLSSRETKATVVTTPSFICQSELLAVNSQYTYCSIASVGKSSRVSSTFTQFRLYQSIPFQSFIHNPPSTLNFLLESRLTEMQYVPKANTPYKAYRTERRGQPIKLTHGRETQFGAVYKQERRVGQC